MTSLAETNPSGEARELQSARTLVAARAWRAIQFFRRTTRVEECFYLRFQRLPDHLLTALQAWWPDQDDWEIFRKICRYWGVSFTKPLPARELPRVEATVRCKYGDRLQSLENEN